MCRVKITILLCGGGEALTCGSQGRLLTCTLLLYGGGEPSRVAHEHGHMWLMCMVINVQGKNYYTTNYVVEGKPSCVAHKHGN